MNWKPYAKLIVAEKQGLTPFCVSYACCNAYEIMAKERGLSINLSDRYLAVMSKTTRLGQSFHLVLNTFVEHGVVREAACPFPWWMRLYYRTSWVWNQICDLSGVNPNEERYKILGHEYVDAHDPSSLQDGLLHGPLPLLIPNPYGSGSHAVVGVNLIGNLMEVYDSIFLDFLVINVGSIQEAYVLDW
jgi:hypothetical protein